MQGGVCCVLPQFSAAAAAAGFTFHAMHKAWGTHALHATAPGLPGSLRPSVKLSSLSHACAPCCSLHRLPHHSSLLRGVRWLSGVPAWQRLGCRGLSDRARAPGRCMRQQSCDASAAVAAAPCKQHSPGCEASSSQLSLAPVAAGRHVARLHRGQAHPHRRPGRCSEAF